MVVDQVLRSEGVDGQRGLSSAEAAGRAQRFGPNQLTAGQAEPRWHAFFRQYRDPMQLVLLVAGIGNLYPTQAADTRQYLRDEITKRNPRVTFVQGLVGIPGVIAAQVVAVTCDVSSEAAEIGYHPEDRTIRVTLPDAARVTIEALWMTSWRPPEPASTSTQVFDGELAAGSHDIVLPDRVPSEASFAAVTVGARVRVLTVGPCRTPSRGWCRNRPPAGDFPMLRPSPPTAMTRKAGPETSSPRAARSNSTFAKFNSIRLSDDGEPDKSDLHLAWLGGARAIRLTPGDLIQDIRSASTKLASGRAMG